MAPIASHGCADEIRDSLAARSKWSWIIFSGQDRGSSMLQFALSIFLYEIKVYPQSGLCDTHERRYVAAPVAFLAGATFQSESKAS